MQKQRKIKINMHKTKQKSKNFYHTRKIVLQNLSTILDDIKIQM